MKKKRKRRRNICKLLVIAREAKGLSQEDVERIGIVSQSTLSKIENGNRKVDFLLLEDLSRVYGVSIDYFKTIDDE